MNGAASILARPSDGIIYRHQHVAGGNVGRVQDGRGAVGKEIIPQPGQAQPRIPLAQQIQDLPQRPAEVRVRPAAPPLSRD